MTKLPAFVRMAPVKVARPPVAIGEPVAGEKSNAVMLVGAAPTAGIAVNSEAAVAVLNVRLFAVASSANCVADGAWNIKQFVSANNTF